MNYSSILTSVAKRHPVMKRVTPAIGGAMLALKRVSPELYLVGGLVAGVAAGVMAARAYKRHEEVLEETKQEIVDAREELEQDGYETRKERAQVLAPLYGRYTAKFVGLYGPTAGLSTLSVYLILTGFGVLKGRNKALVAALQITQAGYNTYRQRVREVYGEDVDERIHLGGEAKRVTISQTDEKTGKTKKTRTEVTTIPENPETSMYAVVFDESNDNWSVDKDINYHFLTVAQQHFNDILDAVGHVLLNDVKDYMRMPRTPEGAVVGWSLKSTGDNWVSFGLDKPINRHTGDNRFVLDFNVNGPIFELIDGEVVGS
jgi:hypothetical protein